MSITATTRKVLWGRAGDECAWRGCAQRLTVDLHDPETEVLARTGVVVGEEAHIRSAKTEGPRNDPRYPTERLDSYDNLILLCPTHHTLADSANGTHYSVDDLVAMKAAQESRVDQRRTQHERRHQQMEERVVAALEHVERHLFDEWPGISAGLTDAVPHTWPKTYRTMIEIGQWLLAKTWPAEYPHLDASFTRLRLALNTLIGHLNGAFEHSESSIRIPLDFARRLHGWDPEGWIRLFREHCLDVTATRWLAYDITRTVNLVIRSVREELDPLFRFEKGVVLLEEGDALFGYQSFRLEYDAIDWDGITAYPTIQEIRAAISADARARGHPVQQLDVMHLHIPPATDSS